MDIPLLSPIIETCGTSETRRPALTLPPPVDPNETNWKNPSIYRVPTHITNVKPNAYQPQVVSFGPYHHGEDHLHPMEEHKNRARLHFLKRSGKPTCEPFLESLREVARDLEESYDALDPKWKDGTGDKFLELMITDGCFMLEIMRMAVELKEEEEENRYAPYDPIFNDYAPYDPIFSKHRMEYITPYISRDMLLLENQLPMLLLERLVEVERDGEECKGCINELILNFYGLNTGINGTDPFLHVMDVYRKGRLTPEISPSATELNEVRIPCWPEAGDDEAGDDEIIRSATELNEAGIHFKKSGTDSLKDISFSKGVLRLPMILLDDTSESMFLNIMAFEHLHIGASTEVTAYVTFMDNIINTEGDVAMLHTRGIIQSSLGSDKAVAQLFNSLCKELPLASNSSLDVVHKEISTHCEKLWNKGRASLTRTYFRSPWSMLSLLAAIITFGLVITQTVYTLLSYY